MKAVLRRVSVDENIGDGDFDGEHYDSFNLQAEGSSLVELIQSATVCRLNAEGEYKCGRAHEGAPWDFNLDDEAEKILRLAFEAEFGKVTDMEFKNAMKVALGLPDDTPGGVL